MTLARTQKHHNKPPALLLPDLQTLSPTGLSDTFFEECTVSEGLFNDLCLLFFFLFQPPHVVICHILSWLFTNWRTWLQNSVQGRLAKFLIVFLFVVNGKSLNFYHFCGGWPAFNWITPQILGMWKGWFMVICQRHDVWLFAKDHRYLLRRHRESCQIITVWFVNHAYLIR